MNNDFWKNFALLGIFTFYALFFPAISFIVAGVAYEESLVMKMLPLVMLFGMFARDVTRGLPMKKRVIGATIQGLVTGLCVAIVLVIW